MKARLIRKFSLEMSESEAVWLMEYVQNPNCEPNEESDADTEMRKKIFDSLKEASPP